MNILARIVVAAVLVFAVSCTKESKKTDETSDPAAKVSAQAESAEASTEKVAAAAPAGEHGDCGEGGSCCGGGGEGGSCCGGHVHAEAPVKDLPDNAEWTTLKVAGMRCGNCAKRIQASLVGVDGILGVRADHGAGEVKIATAPGTENMRGKAAEAINALGYKVLDI